MIKAIKSPFDDRVSLFIFGNSYAYDLSRIRNLIGGSDLIFHQGQSRRVVVVVNASKYSEVPFIRSALEDAEHQLTLFKEV